MLACWEQIFELPRLPVDKRLWSWLERVYLGFRQEQKHLLVMRGWVVGRFWVNATEEGNTVAKCTKRELPHRGLG